VVILSSGLFTKFQGKIPHNEMVSDKGSIAQGKEQLSKEI
jgi:hypothetical protein